MNEGVKRRVAAVEDAVRPPDQPTELTFTFTERTFASREQLARWTAAAEKRIRGMRASPSRINVVVVSIADRRATS